MLSHHAEITPALREDIRREGRRLIAEGRGLIVTRRLLCGAFGITRRDLDLMLRTAHGRSGLIPVIPCDRRAPVFPNHVDLVIALEQFFETSTIKGKE